MNVLSGESTNSKVKDVKVFSDYTELKKNFIFLFLNFHHATWIAGKMHKLVNVCSIFVLFAVRLFYFLMYAYI